MSSPNLRLYVSMLFVLALLVFFVNRISQTEDKYTTSSKSSSAPTLFSSVAPTTSAPIYAADMFASPAPIANSPSSTPSQNPTDRLLETYAQAERRLQAKYHLGYGTYEFESIPNVYPLNGLGVNYDQSYPSTLPSECNVMIVQPDLKIPYTNLLQ